MPKQITTLTFDLWNTLYSADGAQNSGKYFTSSDAGDWDAEGRPTLRVLLGTPLEAVGRAYLPLVARASGTTIAP